MTRQSQGQRQQETLWWMPLQYRMAEVRPVKASHAPMGRRRHRPWCHCCVSERSRAPQALGPGRGKCDAGANVAAIHCRCHHRL
jgi:hypothetical protein